MDISLWDFQQTQKNQLYRSLQTHDRVVLQSPTGSGKTVLAASILQDAVAHNRNAIFIVERKPLIDQTAQKFFEYGLPFGVICGDDPRINGQAPIQIATIQTLARRPNWQQHKRMHLFIVDEVHICHKHHKTLMSQYTNAKWVGLSATPWAKGMGLQWQDLVNPVSTAYLVDQGYLVSDVCWCPSDAQIDIKGVSDVGGEFNSKQMSERTGRIVADAVNSWRKIAAGKKTLVFAHNILDSKAKVARYNAIGVKAMHVDYTTEQAEMDRAIDEFREGDLMILSSVAKLAVGFDAPNAQCLQICKPTKSLMRHYQILGRGARRYPGKKQFIIIDHTSNIERLGMFTDATAQHLDLSIKKTNTKSSKPLPKPCSKCDFLFRGLVCPQCGQERILPIPRERKITQGRLKRFKGGESPQRKLEFFQMLRWIEMERKNKNGWAFFMYRDKFDERPKSPWPIPIEPDKEVRNYVTYRDIRRAKARG